MRKLPIFYSALLLTAVNLLLRTVGTSFQVFLSGRIGAGGMGLLQLVLSVGMLANTAAMAGIRTTAMYLTAEELGKNCPHNVSCVLSGCFTYSILCSGSIALLLWFFSPTIAESWVGYGETAAAIRVLAAFLPVNCLCGVMSGYFTAAGRVGTLAAVEVAEQVCSIITTTCLLFFWAGADATRACQAVVGGGGISACLTLGLLVFLRNKEHSQCCRSIPIAGRLLRLAVPLAGADVVKVGINTLENLMVPKRLALFTGSADPLGDFGRIGGMVFPILMFPAAILFGLCELLIPELARCNAAGSQRRIRYLAGRSLRIACVYGCACGGLMYLCADYLCDTLYRDSTAGVYLRMFAPLAPMLYCDNVTDAMTKGLGQQSTAVRYNILTAAMDVGLLFFLLPVMGIKGYFLSFLVTHLINFLLSLGLLRKITGPVWPASKAMFSLLGGVLAVVAASLLPGWVGFSAFLPVFCALLVLLRVVGTEDVRWIRGLLFKQT